MAKLIDTVSTAQSVIPAWYTNAAMDLLADQKAITDRTYTPYTGARIADLTPDTMAGLEQARQAAVNYQADLDKASKGIGKAVGAGSLSVAQPWYNKAGALDSVGAATPALQQSTGLTMQSVGPLGLSMAQPWLDKAGGNLADVTDYLNPYDDAVVKQIGEIGARTLREQLAPAIRDKFVASGQSGGPGLLTASGQSVDEARALRDVYADTLAKQAELLQQGYTQAQTAKSSDLSRYGTLANTAGQLGFQQQGALSTAAGQIANVGQQYGALTQAQQDALVKIGSGTASASQADTQARMQAAQAQAAMAAQRQQQELAAANALQQAGALQQAQQQKSLDQQYQDFLAQQNYPQAQIDKAVGTFQGVSGGVPQGTVGYEQQLKSGQGASAASTALGALSAAKGLGVI